jgi:hypothetical protein
MFWERMRKREEAERVGVCGELQHHLVAGERDVNKQLHTTPNTCI